MASFSFSDQHYSASFLMEADHDQQLPNVGPKRPARPATFLLRMAMAARPRPSACRTRDSACSVRSLRGLALLRWSIWQRKT